MQGTEERRLRRIKNTPQVELAKSRRFSSGREAIEGNSPEANKRSSLDPAMRGDDTLMVDQGPNVTITGSCDKGIIVESLW